MSDINRGPRGNSKVSKRSKNPHVNSASNSDLNIDLKKITPLNKPHNVTYNTPNSTPGSQDDKSDDNKEKNGNTSAPSNPSYQHPISYFRSSLGQTHQPSAQFIGHVPGQYTSQPSQTQNFGQFYPSYVPQTTSPTIMDQVTIQSIANNFNIINSTLGTINGMHQQTTQLQSEMINVLQKRVNSLTDQNEELYIAIHSVRADLDAFKRSAGAGFADVEKDMMKLTRDVDDKIETIKSSPSRDKREHAHDPPVRWLPMRPQEIHSKTDRSRENTTDLSNTNSRQMVPLFGRIPTQRPDGVRTTFTITPIFPGMIMPNSMSGHKITKRIDTKKDKKRLDTEKKNENSRSLKRTHETNLSEKNSENGSQNLLSLMIFSEMIKQMSGQGGKHSHHQPDNADDDENDVFKEIKMPNMEREIHKTVNASELKNFESMSLKNLDDVASQGQKFIDMIDEHNKKIKDDVKAAKKTKHNKIKNRNDDKMDTLEDFLTSLVDSSINDKKPIEKTKKRTSDKSSKRLSKDSSKDSDSEDYDTLVEQIQEESDNESTNTIEAIDSQTYKNVNLMNVNDDIEKDSDELYNFFGKRYSINPRKLMRLVKPIKVLNTMVGMQDVKGSIFQFVSSFLQGERKDGMLNTAIYGKPGVGKTDLGKILCMIYAALEIVPSAKFKLVKASDLIGQYVGHTRQKTKKVIDEADGGVLFIDEAYALTSGSGDKYSYGKECIDTLNQELSENRRKLVVIIAGYENEIKEGFFKVNQGLERRFPFRYILKDYKQEELKDIFLRMIRLDGDMYLFKAPEKEPIVLVSDETKSDQVPTSSNDVDIVTGTNSETSATNTETLVDKHKIRSIKRKEKEVQKLKEEEQKEKETVTDKDIMALFDDMRYFTNCGGDIENLITQIAFANNERSIGKHPNMKNVFTNQDLKRGLEMFKYHKAEQGDESWRKMFI